MASGTGFVVTAADPLLAEQLAYYRARAREYDEWFERRGRYDRGSSQNRQWFGELTAVRAAVRRFAASGHALELAPGTGNWTGMLLETAERITVVDGAAEMLAVHGERHRSERIERIQGDLFEWVPPRRYVSIFFGFWLSHVPPERFDAFWSMLKDALEPGGRIFFVDSLYESNSTAVDHRLGDRAATTRRRRLNDGRSFDIVKVFYEPAELVERLTGQGWSARVEGTRRFFLYGEVRR